MLKNISQYDNSLYNTLTLICKTYNRIIYFPTKFDVYLSKNFFKISESYRFDENLVYGFSLDMMLYKNISLIGDFKHTFYDINFDGKIDLVPYVNIGLNYKY